MKLHLPTRLRAAVMACFAVVTSLASTLATGAFTGGAFAVTLAALAAPQAEAANYTWNNTGATEGQMHENKWLDSEGNTTTSWSWLTTGTNTIVLPADTTDTTYAKTLKYQFSNMNIGGLTVSTNATGYEIKGDGSNRPVDFRAGNYDIDEDFIWNTNDQGKANFYGSQTWDIASGKTMYIRIGGYNIDLQSGSSVVQKGGGTMKWEGAGIIGSGSYIVQAGVLNMGAKTATGGVFTTAGGKIENGTFGAGSTLGVGTSAVSVGDVTFNGGTLNLSGVNWANTAQVNVSGTVVFNSNAKVELGDLSAFEVNREYQVLSSAATGWSTLAYGNFTQNGGYGLGRSEIVVSDTGFKLTTIGALYTDMTTSGTQTWNYSDAIWETAQDTSDGKVAFYAGDCAVFSADANLTIGETTVDAGGVTVNQGATLTLTGGGNTLQSASIVVNGSLVLKDDVLSSASRVSGAGDLYIDGEVSIENADMFRNRTGNIIVRNGGNLTVAASSGDGVFGKIYGQSGAPVITIQNGGVVDIKGKNDVYYKVILNEGGKYQNTGGDTGADSRQLPYLELAGDGTVSATGAVRMIGGGFGHTTLKLNDHKLVKEGAGTFQLTNTIADAGTIQVKAGTLHIRQEGGIYGQYTGTTIDVDNGALLTINGGTFQDCNINIRGGSGKTSTTSGAALGATVTVGNGSTFQAHAGTYTDTAIVLEAGGTFNYRTSGNHTFKSFNTTGATTLSSADNSSYTMTVAEDSVSTGLLTKSNAGHLAYDGKADLKGGLKITGGSVRFNNESTVAGIDMSDGTALHVGNNADVTLSGASTVKNLTLAAPLTNTGTMVLTGTLTVDLGYFESAAVGGGAVSYVDATGAAATSGYVSGAREYTLIKNTGTLTDTGVTVSAGMAGTYKNGTLTVNDVDDTTFFVNAPNGKPDTITAVDLGTTTSNVARRYSMNGGTLIIDNTLGDKTDDVLLRAIGDSGTIKLTASSNIATGSSSQSGAALVVSGTLNADNNTSDTVLTVGADKSTQTSIASFSSVTLDGGMVVYNSSPFTISNLSTGTKGGVFRFADFKDSPNWDNAALFSGATNLVGNLVLTSQYKYYARFEQLSGSGNFDVRGTENEVQFLAVDSLGGYSGKIILNKGAGTTEADIATGSTAVSFKGISATGGMTLNLDVEAATTMSEGISLTNGTAANVTIGAGASLKSKLAVTGGNNSLGIAGGSLNGNIQLNDGAGLTTTDVTATGNLVLGNNTTLTVGEGKTMSVGGMTELGETSTLTKAGAGTLNVAGASTLDTLSVTGGAVKVQSGTIGNLMVSAGTAHITGATASVGNDGYFSSTHKNGIYIKGVGEVNIGDGTTTSVVTVTRVEMGDAQTGVNNTLNVKTGSRLVVTGTEVLNNYHTTGFILGEWAESSTANVGGRLLLKQATINCGDVAGYVNVKNGGLVATKGFINNKNNDGSLTLVLEDGGTLVLGTTGIAAKNITTTLGAGIVGLMADSTISKNVTLGSAAGTTFDTTLYTWTTDGTDVTKGSTGGTLMVSGVFSGAGRLVKSGAGTLKLTAANTYSGGTSLTDGTLEVAAESALGSGPLTISGGVLNVTGNITLGNTVAVTMTGGSLKASHANGWTLTGASVGGAAVDNSSTGKVTLKNTTITGNITGNNKLALAGTANATADATLRGMSVGDALVVTTASGKTLTMDGIAVDKTFTNNGTLELTDSTVGAVITNGTTGALTLNDTTLGAAVANSGTLTLSGTQNVTLAGSTDTKYADVYDADGYDSSDYGDNGFKSTMDSYTLVTGTAGTAASGVVWQVKGTTVQTESGKTVVGFDGNNLSVQTHDTAGKVYYINSGTVTYEDAVGCTAATKLQLVGGKLVLNKELDTDVTTDGIVVTGTGTALELNSTLAVGDLGVDSGASVALSGTGTLEMGTTTALAAGLSLSETAGDTWSGTVKVTGATLADADLGGLGVSGSTIELNGSSGSLKGGTYAAAVKLTNSSQVALGDGNTFNAGLDATGIKDDKLAINGKNTISTLTMNSTGTTLEMDLIKMGFSSLKNFDGTVLDVETLAAGNGEVQLNAIASEELLLTMSDGQSITLADITTSQADLVLALINADTMTPGTPSDSLEVEDENGFTYIYTLSKDTTSNQTLVKVTAKLNAAGWIGTDDGDPTTTDDTTWKDTDTVDTSKWAGAIDPVGKFYGFGSGTVTIEEDGVTTKSVIVSASVGTTDYTFEGGTVNAEKLAVNDGSLIVNNAGVTLETTAQVSDDASLTVNAGKELTVGADMGVLDQATLSNAGSITVDGTLSVGTMATVNNSGTIDAGSIDASGATIGNTGTLIVGGGEIGALTGEGALENGGNLTIQSDTTLGELTNTGTLNVAGDLAVKSDITTGGTINIEGDADLKGATLSSLTVGGNAEVGALSATTVDIIGTLDADSLTVGTSAKVGSDATLGELTNKGSLEVGGKLTVTNDITMGGTVKADAAELATASFDSLTTTGAVKATALTVKEADLGSLNETALTVLGGTAKVGTDTTLTALNSTGTLAINGDLTVKAPVAAGGTVTADNVTVAGDAVLTALTTGKLTASSLTVGSADITTLGTDKLTVNGGTVAVTDDVSLSKLSGKGTLTVNDKLTLTDAADGTVGVQAAEIVLHTVGSTLGAVKTDAITMAEGSTLSRETALMTVESIAALTADKLGVAVSDSAFDALGMNADGSYSVGDYLIIDGVSSADMFTYVDSAQLDAIRYTGKTAGLVVTNGVLSLSIAQATDENGMVIGNVWNTDNGNTTTSNGYRIPVGGLGFYKSLDYVSNVVVSDEYTIDLTPDMVGDSMEGNATEPEAGLLVRNLTGGGTLTIRGDGAEQDVVSIFETVHGMDGDAVKVVVDAATLNVGLPVGNAGVMAEDAAATGATLARLSLKNLARAEVNADSVVTGATDLEDFTKLMVADGMTLETGQLLGGDNAEVGGRIVVRKSGYYTGQYDEAYIGTVDGADVTLRVGGRRGLSLTAGGGTVKLLSAGQDGRMESLRVGPNPMARLSGGSTALVLDNTTLRADGSVEHHMTTIAAEEGNFINKSTVSLSLGAAETARTLNTAANPVVLDGVADVTDSAVKVNMIGAAVTEGVLDVTTDADKNLTLARLTMAGGAVSGNTVTLTGTAEMMALVNKYYTNARLDANGAIKVDRVTDYYGRAMGGLSENGLAGVQMADAALVKLNPQSDRDDYKELAEVLDTLDAVVKGGDTEAADQLGSALAGSSVAAMGAALAGDMERQLRAIRNRTTTMGVDQTAVNQDMPYFNAWINAEGDLRRLDQDTTYAGYDLTSWGGTVGFDVDVTPQLTFGLAVTSMWGDFTAKGCELAEGELQTNYVTAFARYGARRWVHTFVASVGMSETSLERTVNHANGSYTTEGDADGVSYGFLYEVGYVFAANEAATACIQPVVNVMLAHSSLSGYDESGSSAALSTGDVDMTTLTIGAGLRAQAVMGENLYNRASIVEARALLKVRSGDREATAENALLAVPGSAVAAKAAEMGVMSCELGVGVTVPLGAGGSSLFADASVDVGGGYSDFNGTVGYRINF